MGNNGIGTYYYASFQDTPCDHAHRTLETAETCAARTIRAAHRGVQFRHPADSDWIREHFIVDDADQCVHSKTYSQP